MTVRPWTAIAGILVLSPLLYDCGRWASGTGIYTSECAGVVESARPTYKSVYEWFESDNYEWRTRSRRRTAGHYVAWLKRDDGRRQKVAIAHETYYAPLKGRYLVCDGEGTIVFDTRPTK